MFRKKLITKKRLRSTESIRALGLSHLGIREKLLAALGRVTTVTYLLFILVYCNRNTLSYQEISSPEIVFLVDFRCPNEQIGSKYVRFVRSFLARNDVIVRKIKN